VRRRPLFEEVPLASGARARLRGPAGGPAAVLLGGGVHPPVRGTWSATITELADGLRARIPGLRTVEVRYRVASTRRLDACRADAQAALGALTGPAPIALVGFSMGGALAIELARSAEAQVVVGVAPWVPGWLDLGGLAGRRARIVQGTLDSDALGLFGVSPSSSRAALARMRAAGADADLVLVRGATHGLALPVAPGRRVLLPGVARMLDAAAEAVAEALDPA
jgi:dienelactone hydrolase